MALIKSATELLRHIPAEQKKRVGRPPTNRKCDRPYCDEKHAAHGLCNRHRYIKQRWGNPDHIWVRPPRDRAIECGCPEHLGAPKR